MEGPTKIPKQISISSGSAPPLTPPWLRLYKKVRETLLWMIKIAKEDAWTCGFIRIFPINTLQNYNVFVHLIPQKPLKEVGKTSIKTLFYDANFITSLPPFIAISLTQFLVVLLVLLKLY